MDKNKFRNEKAKAYSEKAILKMLAKAFPADESEDDDEDYEEEDEKSKKKPAKSSYKPGKKPEPEEDDDWEDEEEETAQDYTTMSPKELFNLCKERDIEVVPKKPAKYYINLLKEYDEAQEDWADDDDEDEWEENDG